MRIVAVAPGVCERMLAWHFDQVSRGRMRLHKFSGWTSCIPLKIIYKLRGHRLQNQTLVDCIYRVPTCMPDEGYRNRIRSLLLCHDASGAILTLSFIEFEIKALAPVGNFTPETTTELHQTIALLALSCLRVFEFTESSVSIYYCCFLSSLYVEKSLI